jgi:hypothetical protein
MSDSRSPRLRGSTALIALVCAILAVGCSSRAPLPENLDHRSVVETPDVTLIVLQQVEPDGSAALIVDQLQAALPLFAARLPRGLKEDHIDAILLEPAAFREYVREVMGRDPGNLGAFCLSDGHGRDARLFVQLPVRSGNADLDALRNHRVRFEAVHEMGHAWLGGTHASMYMGPSEEGVCNWIAAEAVGGSPDRLDWMSNALVVDTVFDAAERRKPGAPEETTAPARISKWAHTRDGLAYMLQALYVDWLHWSVDRDDAVLRAELDDFLGKTLVALSDSRLKRALKDPQGPPFDSYIDRIAAADQATLETWMASTHRGSRAPVVDYSVTASSMIRQSPRRWLVDPWRIAMRVMVGPAGTWSVAPVRVHPEITLSYPGGRMVVEAVRRKETRHVDITLGRSATNGAGWSVIRLRVREGRFECTGDGEVLFEGEPAALGEGTDWSVNLLVEDRDDWPADAYMVLEFTPGTG